MASQRHRARPWCYGLLLAALLRPSAAQDSDSSLAAALSRYFESQSTLPTASLTFDLSPSSTTPTNIFDAIAPALTNLATMDPSAAFESALSLYTAAAQPTATGRTSEFVTQSSESDSDSGLSTGAIVAIAVCVTLAVVCCIAGAWFLIRRRRRLSKRALVQQDLPPPPMQQHYAVPQIDGNPVSELQADTKPYEIAGNGVSELYAPPKPPVELPGIEAEDMRGSRRAW